jgi:hypothetical protein
MSSPTYNLVAQYNILVQVDIQNVYYGARNYRPGAAVDYQTLLYKIVLEGNSLSPFYEPKYDFYGYVVKTPKYDGIKLFTLLRKLGYRLRYREFPEDLDPEVHWKGSVGAMMQMDYVDWCPQYNHVIVVSGSGVFAPVFRASKSNWPYITRTLVAWENTVHDVYKEDKDLVDNILYLDDSVLR